MLAAAKTVTFSSAAAVPESMAVDRNTAATEAAIVLNMWRLRNFMAVPFGQPICFVVYDGLA
ncbi:hypothetical protein D3C71_2185810 [compost metagenome]